MGGLPKHHGVSMGVADLNHGVIKLHMAPSSVTQEALRSTEVFAAHTLLHAPCILDVASCIRHGASCVDGDDVGENLSLLALNVGRQKHHQLQHARKCKLF